MASGQVTPGSATPKDVLEQLDAVRDLRTTPGAWIFYAREGGDWASDLQPEDTIFWIHGNASYGGAYRKRLRVGDTILVIIANEIIASGVLLADDTFRLVDDRERIRRPVRILQRFPKPLDRRTVQQGLDTPLIRQGAVHPLPVAALRAVNAELAVQRLQGLPFPDEALSHSLKTRSLNADLRNAAPIILPDESTANALNWKGEIWRPGSSAIPPSPEPEPGPVPLPDEDPETDTDARIPYVLDAPASSEDELERGPFALFLAQRLHLIWCQMNGHAPDADGKPLKPAPPDADTFIVHVDSPWGGGKTTFANFLARVLDPRDETMGTRHFLRSSLASTEGRPEEVDLDDVFAPSYAKTDPEAWPGARRPWIIARYNAWRDQYVQPPWWQIFMVLYAAIHRELFRDALKGLAGFATRPAWPGLVALAGWTWMWAQRWWYQLITRKLVAQLAVVGLTVGFFLGLWRLGVISSVLTQAGSGKTFNAKALTEYLSLLAAVLTFGGASIAAIFTTVSQSVAPDLDFSAENRQIGVADPIKRFRKMFDRVLRATPRPVLLIVDDLDRCDPKTVVEILRGFQTIIRSPRLFVLLLGDRAWIETAHDVYHKDLGGMRGGEGTLGALFVQKVIQLSFRLPTMRQESRERYARRVLGETTGGATAAQVTTVLRAADVALSKVAAADKSVGGKEVAAQKIVAEAVRDFGGLSDAERDAATQLVEELAALKLVAASGSDARSQRSVFNAVSRLIDCLPNNPRQIKRIFMAVATYETVGRVYFKYQLEAVGPDGPLRARRWRQLAMWVTLATEWPETWRAIARYPELLDAAYGARKSRADIPDWVTALDEPEQKIIKSVLGRMRTDPTLTALLSRREAASTSGPVDDFAHTAMEPEAVREFNRIIWEPGFRL
jgi:hypothetical protein